MLAAGASTTKFSGVVNAKAVAITGAFGVALAVVGVASVREFAKFDDAMAKSLAIMGDVSDVMRKDLSDAAREVGRATSFTATQAGEAFFFLASAGLTAQQSLAAMPQVATFAQAGMFNLALATDLLTDAQSALGLTVDDTAQNIENMARVSDVLVKANTLANATVEQFSRALTTKAGAALRAVNKDLEEGVAVLAVFADQGIKGELAGTRLAIVLRDLQTKAIVNRKEFARLNVEVFDSEGVMRNFADIIEDLEGALEGASDETRKSTLLNLGFSDRSISALQATLGFSKELREYETRMRTAGGITQEVADKNLDSLTEQFGLLGSEIADVAIGIGEKLEPSIRSLVEGMIGLFAIMRGKVAEIEDDSIFTVIDVLSRTNVESLEKSEGAVKRLRDAMRSVIGVQIGVAIKKLTDDQLRIVQNGLEQQIKLSDEGSRLNDQLIRKLELVNELLNERFRIQSTGPVPFTTGPETGAVFGPGLNEEAARAAAAAAASAITEGQVSVRERAQEIVAAGTVTLVDNARAALQDFLDEAVEAGDLTNEKVKEAIESLEANIRVLELSEPVERELKEIDRALKDAFDEESLAPIAGSLAELEQQLIDMVGEFPESSVQRGRIIGLLDRVRDKRRAVSKDFFAIRDKEMKGEADAHKRRLKQIEDERKARIKAAKDIEKSQRESQQNIRNLVQDISNGVGAVINLGQAFGFMSDETARALSSVVDLGAGIGRIAAGDILGGGLQAAKGLTGLFVGGGAGANTLEANTRALERLTRSVDQQASLLGRTAGGDIQAAIDTLLRFRQTEIGRRGVTTAFDIVNLEELGFGIRNVIEQAKKLGITFASETSVTFAELDAALRALSAISIEQAFEGFAGQLNAMRIEMELMDQVDPQTRLEKLRELFLEFTNLPKFTKAFLRNADLTTAAGRAQFEQQLRDIFAGIRSGALGVGALGQLNIDEFIQAILDMEKAVDDLDGAVTDTGQTQQIAVQRTVTEVTSLRLVSLINADVFFNEQTAQNTAQMVQLMGGRVGFDAPTIEPPDFVRAAGAAGVEINIEVHVHLSDGVSVENAREIGTQIGDTIADRIDNELGDRLREGERVGGGIVTE